VPSKKKNKIPEQKKGSCPERWDQGGSKNDSVRPAHSKKRAGKEGGDWWGTLEEEKKSESLTVQ